MKSSFLFNLCFFAFILCNTSVFAGGAQFPSPGIGQGGSPLSVQYGGTGSTSLGNDLTNANSILNVTYPVVRSVSSSTDQITSSDCGAQVKYTRSSPVAVSLAAASTTGLTQGCGFTVNNFGAGLVTITPNGSTINANPSMNIPQETGCFIYSDGTNYQVDLSSCTSLTATNPVGTLALDGVATSVTGNTTTVATSLANTYANDVIIVHIAVTNSVAGTIVSSIADNGPGLNWIKRSAASYGSGSTFVDFEEWYAVSPSIFNATITAIFLSAPGGTRIMAFGVHGANLSSPFDVNASLPSTNGNNTTGSSLAPSSSIATSNSATMLISSFRAYGSAGTITNPSGYTTIGSTGAAEQISYQIYSSAQSGLTPTYSWTTGSQTNVGIWDAIQASAP